MGGSNEACRGLQHFSTRYFHFLIFSTYIYLGSNLSGHYSYYINNLNQALNSVIHKDLESTSQIAFGEWLGNNFSLLRPLISALTNIPDVTTTHSGRVYRYGLLLSLLLPQMLH